MDDTGQPTVDRLGALEAALRYGVSVLETEYRSDPTLQDLAASLRAALDAASPLTGPVSDRTASNTDTTTDKAASTTPTPDQGAPLTLHQRAENFIVSLIPFDLENPTMVALAAEAALGEFLVVERAATSEARAAEREAIVAIIKEHETHYAAGRDCVSDILGAIATSAQSET